MITTRYDVRGEIFTKPNPPHKSYQGVEAFAKCSYDALFEWLVTRMDNMLSESAHLARTTPTKGVLHIGVLDIFGFENFKQNGWVFLFLCLFVCLLS